MSKLRIEEAGDLSRMRSLVRITQNLCNKYHAKIYKFRMSREKGDSFIKLTLLGSRKVLKKILMAVKKDKRFYKKAKFV
jgi:hypothetical protein